jgi:hypothetical protein
MKKARATGRDQKSIKKHYTQVDFDDDSSVGLFERISGYQWVLQTKVSASLSAIAGKQSLV